MVFCPELLAVFRKRLVGEEPRLAGLKQTSLSSVRSCRPVLPPPRPSHASVDASGSNAA